MGEGLMSEYWMMLRAYSFLEVCYGLGLFVFFFFFKEKVRIFCRYMELFVDQMS